MVRMRGLGVLGLRIVLVVVVVVPSLPMYMYVWYKYRYARWNFYSNQQRIGRHLDLVAIGGKDLIPMWQFGVLYHLTIMKKDRMHCKPSYL